MTKPRIGIVTEKFSATGGSERVAFETTRRLVQTNEFEVHVFGCQQEVECPGSQFHCVDLPRLTFSRKAAGRLLRPVRPILFARNVAASLRRFACDVVHSHERIFAADVCSLHGTPHEYWARTVRNKRLSLFDRSMRYVERKMILASPAAWLLPVSQTVASLYRQHFEIAPDRMQVVAPGIDHSRFNCTGFTQSRQAIRSSHGISPSSVCVLFVGTNWAHKGLFPLIDALADLIHSHSKQADETYFGDASIKESPCLLVVGKGDQEAARRYAAQRNVARLVHFAGVVSDNIERYYQAVDILALPSNFETFGLVVLEAMAAGLPVIVKEKVGACEIVTDGEDGYVVGSENVVQQISDALLPLMDSGKRQGMANRATQTARQFSWEKMTEKHIRIYETLLKESYNTRQGLRRA